MSVDPARSGSVSRRSLLVGTASGGLVLAAFGGDQLAAAATDLRITAIRNEVAAINARLGRLKRTTRNVEGVSLEGAEATYWSSGTSGSSNSAVQKISARVYGETFRDVFDIYYKSARLIFVYDLHERYVGDFTGPVASAEQRRLYQNLGTVVRVQIGTKIVDPNAASAREVSRYMQSAAGDLLAAF